MEDGGIIVVVVVGKYQNQLSFLPSPVGHTWGGFEGVDSQEKKETGG